MRPSEIKVTVDSRSDEDSFPTAAHYQHRANDRDPVYIQTLTTRMDAMDKGNKVSWNDVVQMHQSMEQNGE